MNTDAILKPCYNSIALPEMEGKPMKEVLEHLKNIYSEDKLAKIPRDLNTLPDEFKDGNWYYFFGSIGDDGENTIPFALWIGERWSRYTYWILTDWFSPDRGVLLND